MIEFFGGPWDGKLIKMPEIDQELHFVVTDTDDRRWQYVRIGATNPTRYSFLGELIRGQS